MRKRTLTFQQIADSRFNENQDTLNHVVERIFHDLFHLPGLTVKAKGVYELEFKGKEPSKQWRVNFYIYKDRRVTWSKIMEIVNNIQAPFYKFI